jgi:hypothetical protein
METNKECTLKERKQHYYGIPGVMVWWSISIALLETMLLTTETTDTIRQYVMLPHSVKVLCFSTLYVSLTIGHFNPYNLSNL